MNLRKYRVTNFRSVVDSEWIDARDITAFIGENETGKTNLLLPLWKLNPAGAGAEIDLLADMPRASYHTMRTKAAQTVFVSAEFEVEPALAAELGKICGHPAEQLLTVQVSRTYDGKYYFAFPAAKTVKMAARSTLVPALEAAKAKVTALQAEAAELWAPAAALLDKQIAWAKAENVLIKRSDAEQRLSNAGLGFHPDQPATASLRALLDPAIADSFNKARDFGPEIFSDVGKRVLATMPKFIYYSNYGTIDTRLYLPRVIEDLARPATELSERQRAQTRTIRVLFDFLTLSAQEILDLGRESSGQVNQAPATDEEIQTTARRKEEREVLLKSAATSLSKDFREWWQRGEYNFSFSADGSYFTIWVSDDQRAEPIQLEGRSQGLQWFFSFFIVFLAERGGHHSNTVLLLDEPGVTLHPLAQEDLFRFFERLSKDNQLIYTSHSPFLVDPDRLSDVRVVFVNDAGETSVSADLRKAERDKRRARAIYAVDAALGLSVSDTLMRYAQPSIVEGSSDQIYLTVAKGALIAGGMIRPRRELVFIAAGGVHAIATTASIVGITGLPGVVLDSDSAGREKATQLGSGAYAGHDNKLISVGEFVTIEDAEIEDLMPAEWIIDVVDRIYHAATTDELFRDAYDPTKSIVPQIVAFCARNGIELRTPGWKVDVATEVARRAMRQQTVVEPAILARWQTMFERIVAAAE